MRLPCKRAAQSRHRCHGVIDDRIATQRYSSPEIPIGSRVMSRTTSAPSGMRSRKIVANVAGCRSFCTFRDCHTVEPLLYDHPQNHIGVVV